MPKTMTILLCLTFLLLGGCTSPEERAGDLALKFTVAASTPPPNADVYWPLVCPKEQEFKSLDKAKEEDTEALADLMKDGWGSKEGFSAPWTLGTVVLNETLTSAVVTLEVASTDFEDGPREREVIVRKDDDAGWCVESGWVEKTRRSLLGNQFMEQHNKLAMLNTDIFLAGIRDEDYKIPGLVIEAQQARDESARLMAERRADAPDRMDVLYAEWHDKDAAKLAEHEAELAAALADREKFGLWTRTVYTDPMTDVKSVIVTLPGNPRDVSIIIRATCRKKGLVLFVNTGRMLDMNYRTYRTPVTWRLDQKAPVRLTATPSDSMKSAFLDQPDRRVKELSTAAEVIIQVDAVGTGRQTLNFDVRKLSANLSEIPTLCSE